MIGYTCDRCGATSPPGDTGLSPADWSQVVVGWGQVSTRRDLCDLCTGDLNGPFLEGAAVISVATRQAGGPSQFIPTTPATATQGS